MTTILHDMISKSPRLRPGTKKLYLGDIERWIAFAGTNPKNWTPYRTQDFYQQLLTEMQPQSANRVIASIRYAARWWSRMENDPKLDFTQIQLAQNKKPKPRKAFTEETARKFLETDLVKPFDRTIAGGTSLRDLALCIVGFETGMRRMSMESMTIENTKMLPEGYPAACVQLKGIDGLYPVPLSDTAMSVLSSWLAWLKSYKITTGAVWRNLLHRVDKKRMIGEGMSTKTIYNIVERRAEAAGIGHIHPHLFRHTYVTWRLVAEVPAHVISAVTGHRLPGDKLGMMFNYVDQPKLAAAARATTPAWLAAWVQKVMS